MIKIKNNVLGNYVKVNTESLEGDPGETNDGLIVPSQDVVKEELDKKQPTLVSGENIKTINNESILGEGDIEIAGCFIVEYNITSWQDILDAYTAGKSIFCKLGSYLLPLTNLDTNTNSCSFTAAVSSFRITQVSYEHNTNPSWRYNYYSVVNNVDNKENKSNKVTSISSSSTDAQYPSAKCVYDLVSSNKIAITYDV